MSALARRWLEYAEAAHGITTTDVAVGLAVLAHRNRHTGEAFPSLPTIAREVRLGHQATVYRALQRLEAAGLVAVERAAGRHNVYRFPLVDNLADSSTTTRAGARGLEAEPRASERGTTRVDARGPRAPTRVEVRKKLVEQGAAAAVRPGDDGGHQRAAAWAHEVLRPDGSWHHVRCGCRDCHGWRAEGVVG